MRKLALMLVAGALAVSAFAGSDLKLTKKAAMAPNKYWVIDVGLFKPNGDLDDAGVDTGWMGSINYFFGNTGGNSNSEWYVGVGGLGGDGDSDLEYRSYGIHAGVLIGLGKEGEDNPWAIDLRGGWYRSKVTATVDVIKAGSEDLDKTENGFGGSVAVVFKSKSGPRFSLGWFTQPEINGSNIDGYFFNVGFPFGGK